MYILVLYIEKKEGLFYLCIPILVGLSLLFHELEKFF
jgi:hypothetical protein